MLNMVTLSGVFRKWLNRVVVQVKHLIPFIKMFDMQDLNETTCIINYPTRFKVKLLSEYHTEQLLRK